MPKFKLLHFSDSHLGFKQYRLKERVGDFAKPLSQIAEIAITHQVDLVVDTGDTFDSPSPDPFSVKAYREFAELLKENGIKLICIDGNHNTHELTRFFGETWASAVSDWIIVPQKGAAPEVHRINSRSGDSFIDVVMANWMPSQRLPEFIGGIPRVVDALFLHQSCENMIPAISNPELKIGMVEGKARYVGVGDIHVTKKIDTDSRTVIGSVGSTEVTRDNEPREKFVAIVTFGDGLGLSRELEWTPVSLSTRPILSEKKIQKEEDLDRLRSEVMRVLDSGEIPLVSARYSKSMSDQVDSFLRSMAELGVLTRFIQEPDVSMIMETPDSQSNSIVGMDEAIDSMNGISDEAKVLSKDLWYSNNPNEILDAFRQNLIKQYEDNQGNT